MPFALIPTLMVAVGSKLELARQSSGGTSTYKGGNYCGPAWGYTYQDILDGKIKELPAAVDAIDEACKAHDYCYQENGYFTQGCNLVLSADLAKVVIAQDSTPQQRVDAAVMAAVFLIETQTIDLGVILKEEAGRMRDRMLGYMGTQAHTLEQAIQREMMNRTAMPGLR